MLEKLLNPRSIVVVGGSEDLSKPGGLLLKNILTKGFPGDLLVVHPKSPQIQGVKAYPSITELPLVPELALIAIPAQYVLAALEELGQLGTKAVVVLSSGFGEVSEEGKAEENRLAETADQYGILLLGPNCSGVVSHAHASKFTGFPPMLVEGGIDFISGSGATVDFLAEQAFRRGLPFGTFLTIGNSAQTGVTDLLALFDQRHGEYGSNLKILYLESIQKPAEFLQHARSLRQKGCLMAGIKAGTTEAGSRAAASHTGAMVSDDTAVQALFDKAGIIRVQSRMELIDVANALVCAKGKYDGRRVCVVSDAGGPGVLLADELNRQGFSVPQLKESTQRMIAAVLHPGAGVSNPIDCLPSRTGAMIAEIFAILNREEAGNIDYIAFITGDSGLSDIWANYQAVAEAMETSDIPIFPSFCAAISTREKLKRFRQLGKSYFEDEVYMARAMGKMLKRPRLSTPPGSLPGYDHDHIASLLTRQHGALSPDLTQAVLSAAGLRFPAQQTVTCRAGLAQVELPFPWALKVAGPLHKSDLGGVKLGIASLAEAEQAWDTLMQIEGAQGCLVQPMVSGSEVILGVKRDALYGSLVAFGLGGIYTEALKDVNFCLAPLSEVEALKMIKSLRTYPILEGMRGQLGMDTRLLADWIMRIGKLASDFPQIQEMDLNPVKGFGDQLFVVDARLIVD